MVKKKHTVTGILLLSETVEREYHAAGCSAVWEKDAITPTRFSSLGCTWYLLSMYRTFLWLIRPTSHLLRYSASLWRCFSTLPSLQVIQLHSKLFNPHCKSDFFTNLQLFLINNLNSSTQPVLQVFSPNSRHNATLNAVSKLFHPFLTSIFSNYWSTLLLLWPAANLLHNQTPGSDSIPEES